MSRFFEELKRRNVIKSTIAYLVVSWIIIQVALAVLPTFGAPAWINQAIIIALAVGLPIWAVLSWMIHERTAQIGKPTASAIMMAWLIQAGAPKVGSTAKAT